MFFLVFKMCCKIILLKEFKYNIIIIIIKNIFYKKFFNKKKNSFKMQHFYKIINSYFIKLLIKFKVIPKYIIQYNVIYTYDLKLIL
jgi:hypothetical protein